MGTTAADTTWASPCMCMGRPAVTYWYWDGGLSTVRDTIEATLLYESLSVRTAEQLFQSQTSEIAAFRNYYQAADRTPDTVCTDKVVAP